MNSINDVEILKILIMINISALFYISFSFIPTMIKESGFVKNRTMVRNQKY